MYAQLPLNALRSFEAVARLGSFMAAAAELRVTPSAISHQMRQLEEWAGGKLIVRSGKGLRLLPHGEMLSLALRGAFGDVASACRRVQGTQSGHHLVIAVIPSVATCWLIPNLTDFRQRHPSISTRIIYAIHGQPIDFGEVDVAIVYFREPARLPGVVLKKLLPGESAPVCSSAFMELHGLLQSPQAIAEAGLIHDTDMQSWRKWLGKATGAAVLPPDGPVFEDFNLLRASTLAGQGVSLCPLSIIHDDLVSGRLRQLSDLTVLSDSGYYTAQPETGEAHPRPDVQAFLGWVAALAARQTAHQ